MFSRSTLFIAVTCCTSALACSDLLGADFDDVHLRPNQPPRAEDVVLENVVEGTEGNTLQLVGSDPEQDALTFELASEPRGTVSWHDPARGLLSYASEYGVWKDGVEDRFEYRVRDRAPSAEALVTVRLLPAGPVELSPEPPPLPSSPGDPRRNAYFGASVDFDGDDRVIVGSTGDGAYLLNRQPDGTWHPDKKIEPQEEGDLPVEVLRKRSFGLKAALSGEWALVSAFGDVAAIPAPPGRAYFYKLGSLDDPSYKPQVVCASDNCDGLRDAFGFELVLEGGYAIIAARDEPIVDPLDPSKNTLSAGAVYVYELEADRWKQLAKLRAPQRAAHDLFGSSIAFDGETLVVAASGTDTPNDPDPVIENTGALYVYEKRSWRDSRAEPKRLRLPRLHVDNMAEYDTGQVAVSGNYLLCGTPDEPLGNGAAFIYDRERAQWEELARPPPPADPQKPAVKRFGAAVAIHGDIAVVTHLDLSNNGGAVIYRREIQEPGSRVTWRQLRIWDSVGQTSAGWAAAAQGNSVLVGAHHGGGNGHVYAFHVPLPPGVVFTKKTE